MPPPIGDNLPDFLKVELADLHLKIKAVIKIFCTASQKEKRFIVMGLKYDSTQIALLYINSEINQNIFPSAMLQNEHIKMSSEGREYLTHESFVDCTSLCIRSKQEVHALMVQNPSVHLGEVSDEDYKILRDKICDSRLITNSTKKDFGLFLK